jgi:hypothetical protein
VALRLRLDSLDRAKSSLIPLKNGCRNFPSATWPGIRISASNCDFTQMPRWAIVYVAALCGSAAFGGLRRSIPALASAPRPQVSSDRMRTGCAFGLRLEIRRPSGGFDVPQRARFNQNFGQSGSHCWTEPTKRFLEAASWIELYRSTHRILDSPHEVRFFDWRSCSNERPRRSTLPSTCRQDRHYCRAEHLH